MSSEKEFNNGTNGFTYIQPKPNNDMIEDDIINANEMEEESFNHTNFNFESNNQSFQPDASNLSNFSLKSTYHSLQQLENERQNLENERKNVEKKIMQQLKEEQKNIDKKIKEKMKKIEQLKMEIFHDQKDKEALEKRLLEMKGLKTKPVIRGINQPKVLLTFSNNSKARQPNIDRKLNMIEDFKSRTMSIKDICEKYKITRQTFYNIKKSYQVYQAGLEVEKEDSRGRNCLLNKDQLASIFYEVESRQNGEQTGRELVNLIQEQFGKKVSTSTIYRGLLKAECTWKTSSNIPGYWNEPQILELRKKFVQSLPYDRRNKKEYYVCEISFNLDLTLGYTWALKGNTETLEKRNKSKPIHLLLAICNSGDIIKMYFNRDKKEMLKSITEEEFKLFFEENIHLFNNSIVYLNSNKVYSTAFTHPKFTNKLMENNIHCIWYPLYSPYLNPAEYFTNYLKRDVGDKQYKSRDELYFTIECSINSNYTTRNIQLFIDKAESLFQDCLVESPIVGFILPNINRIEVDNQNNLNSSSINST
ncbi:hypothetical protein K502DRAFT_325757 [Neoconidiobolus thromboides FSU 785]|nr:hypothetical protein K502DRAFT_325757 [Neoconidiobolus thromboides FSU 785]